MPFLLVIPHLKRRTLLWPRLSPVVEPGCGNIRMPEAFLHLGDIGLVVERIGRGGGPERMRTETFDVQADNPVPFS